MLNNFTNPFFVLQMPNNNKKLQFEQISLQEAALQLVSTRNVHYSLTKNLSNLTHAEWTVKYFLSSNWLSDIYTSTSVK